MAAIEALEAGRLETVERELERERREITGAIALVGERGFPSVILANLAHARHVAEELTPLATSKGVRIELIGHQDDLGSDLVIRRR